MSADWDVWEVGELESKGLLLVQDGNHGEYRPRKSEFANAGVAFIRAADLNGGEVQFENAEKINDVAFNRIRKGVGCNSDTILSTKGTVGKLAFVPKDSPAFVCSPQTSFWRSLNHDFIDPKYLFYEMQSNFFMNQVSSKKGETDMADYLSLTTQRGLKFRVPNIYVQHQIVKILSPVDEKMKINHQINQTLEQMAQALFKSWFVDFEPVKAKIAVREAGGTEEQANLAAMQVISGKTEAQLEVTQIQQSENYAELKATAELFPDAMQESELGDVPEGWEVGSFSKIADLDTTSVKPNNNLDKLWNHFSIPAFDVNQSPEKEFGITIKSGKYKVKKTAILSSKLNPHFPRTWWPDIEDEESAVCSTEFMQFIPKKDKHRPFIYCLITSSPFQEGILQRVTGTTGSRQRAQPPQVAAMDVIIPSEELIDEFSNKALPLLDRKAKNIKQNASLSELRDTLLPKLLSGELSVDAIQLKEE